MSARYRSSKHASQSSQPPRATVKTSSRPRYESARAAEDACVVRRPLVVDEEKGGGDSDEDRPSKPSSKPPSTLEVALRDALRRRDYDEALRLAHALDRAEGFWCRCMDGFVSATRSLLTGEPRERTVAERIETECCGSCPRLSWRARLIGFGLCFALGLVIELGSFFRLAQLVGGRPKPFALSFTVGNVVSIGSSFFLAGPATQCKSMLKPTRAVATVTYVVAIGATLFVALWSGDVPARAGLIVVLVAVQTVALLWYMLSYIPFARDFARNCCKGCCADAAAL